MLDNIIEKHREDIMFIGGSFLFFLASVIITRVALGIYFGDTSKAIEGIVNDVMVIK